MSSPIDAVLDACEAQGLDLHIVIRRAQARVAEAASQPTMTPDPYATAGSDPIVGPERRGVPPTAAVTLPDVQHASPDAQPIAGLERYEDLGPLGKGGMGEVRRVRDRRLGRILALKTLRRGALVQPALRERFLKEAQATAQLQHPGIVPIHDLGQLPDGRLWFTMKEVTGRTLGSVIAEVHAASGGRWRRAHSGWSLRRLVDALRQVCRAVGYAHGRGVVHRDLKPENIMVGDHGEVLLLDWGLAKVLGRPDRAADEGDLEPVQTDRSQGGAHQTLVGQVAGTPAYMSPEQALGQVHRIDARSDVYALGTVLYEVLSGQPPYEGASALEVLEKVRSEPPVSLPSDQRSREVAGPEPDRRQDAPDGRRPPLPPALVAACERAMARDPAARFDSAVELASELEAWLDGSRREQEARSVVARAAEKAPEAQALRTRAASLRAEAVALLDGVEDWQPEADKLPGWEKEDLAATLEKEAEAAELQAEQLLQGSLTHAPDLPEAHAALAARYRSEHEAAEAAREDPARAEARFRRHLAALPDDHAERAKHLTYLQGHGALTLVTDPPGAEVLLHRYVLHNRRLVTRFERSLGRTPLREETLPMGSYLCVLRHPERAEVRYPVSIGRGEHWHGVPPRGGGPMPIPLPRAGELGPDDCYVPAGWFQCGGDPLHDRSLPAQRVWVDGQVFRRLPVTNIRYIAFLDALVAQGRTDEALRHAPREKGGTAGELGALVYGFDGTRFSLRPDADGDLWDPAWPVCLVDWYGADAFGTWEAERTGLPWHLPGELAWEKAARGVDGRFHPWGDGCDPSWASMRASQRGRIGPTAVGTFPVDDSPYGIRDLAGSMQDWCHDRFFEHGPPIASARNDGHPRGPLTPGTVPLPTKQDGLASDSEASTRVVRGGSWSFSPSHMRVAYRVWDAPSSRRSILGFRLARPYP